MKRVFLAASVAVVMGPMPASAAGLIERACLNSERRAVSAALCACIQGVADDVLDAGEQRKGAALFANPHDSQDLRQSDKSDDESFWLKWKTYGAKASQFCG